MRLRKSSPPTLTAIAGVIGVGFMLGTSNTATPQVPLQSFNRIAPNTLTLTAELLWGNTVYIGEPLLVRLELANLKDEQQSFLYSHVVYFGVYDSSGHLLSSAPVEIRPWELSSDKSTFAPEIIPELPSRGVRVEVYNLDRWYAFDKPGKYVVQCQLFNAWVDEWPYKPVLEHEIQIIVEPANRSHIDARCLELLSYVAPGIRSQGQPIVGLDKDTALRSLFSIQDDAALPYFDYLAKEYASVEACLAIRRVKTKRAEQLIKALAARQDEVGKAARQALKLPLEPKPEQAHTVD